MDGSRARLSWVIRVGLAGLRRLPVYPGERTFSGSALSTIAITAARKCPTFTMICAYIRPAPTGQGRANDSSVP
jgi:hypothetical protein